ncbi:MAG: formate/nitrite transporter family protein [Chloroflexota bacterium]
MAAPASESSPDLMDQQPQDIAERAGDVGRERLDRSNLDIFITGAIGGFEVSLGGLAAMAVVGSSLLAIHGFDLYAALAIGALAFPIGFMFVIIGRSELFTENFLIPVTAVLRQERTLLSLVQVWGFSWLGNMVACAGFAALVSIPAAIGAPILHGYVIYTAYKLSLPPLGLFVSAILAGMIMTVLTWLLLAIRDPVGKILAIFAAGYVIFATNVSHAIVGASLLFVGFRPAGFPVWSPLLWVVIATLGNLVGGVGVVTLFRHVQVKEKRKTGA